MGALDTEMVEHCNGITCHIDKRIWNWRHWIVKQSGRNNWAGVDMNAVKMS